MTITPEQSRAARAMLNWTQQELAKAAGVGLSTVTRFENRDSTPHQSSLTTIRVAMEDAGIVFQDADDTIGAGVHLREPKEK